MSAPPRSALRRGSPARRDGGCTFSRETLALHVEHDLPEAAARIASSHVAACDDCRLFLEQLRARQLLLKSLRRETVSSSECTGMRREVMAIINDRVDRPGWALRIERAIMLGFRRPSYALTACALLGIVSVSVLAQMRHPTPDTIQSVAVFEDRDTLLRPDGYRDWIVVGRSQGAHGSGVEQDAARATRRSTHKVYINPSGYREYTRTGRFPEGTLLVWESATSEGDTADRLSQESPALLASLKDSARFDGGWGFFDFTGPGRTTRFKAQALPESSGCRKCHQQDAETDHVFTQFYPILRSARHGAQLVVPRESASLTGPPALAHASRAPGPRLVAQT